MLGLGKASQYAGWWGGGPARVTMSASSKLGYEVYQTPVFSMNLGQSTWTGCEVDLTGYTSLTGYGQNKFTMMFNYRPDYSNTSYPTGEYLGNIGRMQVLDYSNIGVLPDGWFVYVTATTGYETPVNLSLGVGAAGNNWNTSLDFPGSYLDWMGRWYLIVISFSNTQDDFTDWDAPAFPTGKYFLRCMVIDQETGEVIIKQDRKVNDPNMPNVADLANPLPVDDPYTTTTDCFDARMFGSGSVEIQESLISNFWCSYGTMFDPLSIDQANTSWRTTRPDSIIGTAKAWVNTQYTDNVVEGTTPNRDYWIAGNDDELVYDTASTNKAVSRQINTPWVETDIFDPSNEWDSAVNYDIIPKDRNI
jgi:hypothetical protein